MNSIQKRYTKTVICTRGKKYNMIDWRWFFFSSFDSSLSLSVSRCEFVCVFNAHFTIITIRPPRMKIRYSLNTLNSIRELNTVSLCVHRATYIDWTLNGLYAWRVGRMVSDSLVGVVSYYYYFFFVHFFFLSVLVVLLLLLSLFSLSFIFSHGFFSSSSSFVVVFLFLSMRQFYTIFRRFALPLRLFILNLMKWIITSLTTNKKKEGTRQHTTTTTTITISIQNISITVVPSLVVC